MFFNCSISFSKARLPSFNCLTLSTRSVGEDLTISLNCLRICSSRLISAKAPFPVTASTRRTPAEIPVSLMILNKPMSPVRFTWQPPQNSTEYSPPIVTTRTSSPYFSPNKANAPRFFASSKGMTSLLTSELARISAFT